MSILQANQLQKNMNASFRPHYFKIAILIFTLFSKHSFAQSNTYLLPYQSPDNQYYWKNNKLLPKDYWQQDASYTMRVSIDDKNDIVNGEYYKLSYTNNSPRELKEMYFHLYENAFQPESYYHELWRGNKLEPKFGKHEKQKLGTTTENWAVNGAPVKTELDNTILKLLLDKPIQPGETVEVTCNFKTYWDTGSMRRRNKTLLTQATKHFDGVHWYPIVCVYDKHFTWHTDQHLDKEFYANFGSYDVALTFPQEYIVEATGVLTNEAEVLPEDLKQKIDLNNFKNKPFNSTATGVIPKEEGKTKTWKFYANNVHNFAFTADPLYRREEIIWNGIKVISLAQEPHASKWQESAEFTAKVMETYSKDFGTYIWPKIIVADADDGMEYPMLTLDGGTYPQHQYLLAHEVGHMWFYGMLGSNETYRASLDEGFTQFLTIWSMDKTTGKKKARPAPYKFLQKYADSSVSRYDRLYTPYLTDVWSGYDEPLNTHSHGFNSGIRQSGGYRLVYHKTGVMLYNLKYVLGDSVFLGAMQHYVKKWTGAHPYPEDFRDAITEYVQTDLTWFFDQWMETTKHIDYKLTRIQKIPIKDTTKNDTLRKHIYRIGLQRLGRMQMPIDFTISNWYGQKFDYHIPNTWYKKPTSATILPKWYGWDLLNQKYTATVTIPGGIKELEIDPSHTLADKDLTNNSFTNFYDVDIKHNVINPPSWEKLKIYFKPAIWWNQYDGLQLGAGSKREYFNQNYWQDLTIWGNTGWPQTNIPDAAENSHRKVAVQLSNKVNLSKWWRQLYYVSDIQYNAGLFKMQMGFEKIFRFQDLKNPRYTKFFAYHGLMYRDLPSDTLYLLYPQYWSVGKINSYMQAGVSRYYPIKTKGTGEFTLEARVPGISNEFNYSFIQFTHISHINISKFEWHSRLFARAGFGNTPFESALYLAGASPEEMYGNKLTRAAGFVPQEWLGYGSNVNHFQMGGGLNVRGYAGYLAPVDEDGVQYFNHVGKSGASLSMELDFDKFIPLKPTRFTRNVHFDTYLFHDMGLLSYYNTDNRQDFGKLRMSSGVGTAMTLKIDALNIKPFTLRFDIPLLLNASPAGTENAAVRYVVGVNRSF